MMKTSNILFAATLALGLVATTVPHPAEAGPRSARISAALDRIAVRIDDLRSIHNPYRRAEEIDRLQARLYRLERRSDRQRGRRARGNDHYIDALQARLARVERRNDRRIARQERDWYYAEPAPDYGSDVVILDRQRRLDLEITRDGVRIGVDR